MSDIEATLRQCAAALAEWGGYDPSPAGDEHAAWNLQLLHSYLDAALAEREAEVARLREALQEIAARRPHNDGGYIARAALADTPEPKR